MHGTPNRLNVTKSGHHLRVQPEKCPMEEEFVGVCLRVGGVTSSNQKVKSRKSRCDLNQFPITSV